MLALFRAKHFDHHAVEMKPFHQHPSKGTQEEEMEENSQDFAGNLKAESVTIQKHYSITGVVLRRGGRGESCPR